MRGVRGEADSNAVSMGDLHWAMGSAPYIGDAAMYLRTSWIQTGFGTRVRLLRVEVRSADLRIKKYTVGLAPAFKF